MLCSFRLLASAACLALSASAVFAADTRTGAAAYGDVRSDTPGTTRLITPSDLPAPQATPSTASRSRMVGVPKDAAPQAMPGFKVSVYAADLKGARGLRTAPNGDVFLSLSRPEGKIMVLHPGAEHDKPVVTTFAQGLKDPYSFAFYPRGPDPQWVYVGATGEVLRYPYKNGDTVASGKPEVVISGLPTGGHWTRDVAFSPDGKTLYVAVGSGSNVAEEMSDKPSDLAAFEKTHATGSAWGKEEWRANVLAFDPDGKNRRVYAAGIRNCAGLSVQPGTGTVFCATNERDLLGDNLPPDYITSVKEGAFYGWPWFYIGDHEDHRPGGGARPDLKGKVTVPDVLIQPHSAALNLAFNTGGQFPADWTGDAFATLHGSWNRAQRTGYKIVRLPFKDGKATGVVQDFVTGFITEDDSVWGRPVGITFLQDGSLLFSEDGNGRVYRVSASRP